MKKIYISLFLIICILKINAQEAKIEKSEKLFNGFAYHETINKLENIDEKDIDTNRKLAESHYKIGEYDLAEQYFAEVVSNENKTAEDVYNYAEVLKINKKYSEANMQMKQFAQIKPDDSRAQRFLQNTDYQDELMNDIGQIELYHLEMNSRQQDFGVAYYKEQLIFTSSRTKNKIIQREWNWNKLPFLDLYTTQLNDNKEFSKIKPFVSTFNKKLHEGPASFNREGTFMAYTRNNYEGESEDHRIKLKIFFAQNETGQWSMGEPFPYNSDNYSIGHPALSADGKTMYFASDMPGGMGGVDIYVSQKSESGSWSQPVNLGADVNTEGNEMFPFVHENGLLFYSSNGLPGLGGMDIFVVTMFDEAKAGKPRNIGVPANSSFDDFAFVVNNSQTEGFLSSNRSGGKGNDDIYRFDLLKPFTPDKLIEGVAKTDKGELLSNVYVNLYNDKGELVDSVKTNQDGSFSIAIANAGNYKIVANHAEYSSFETQVDATGSELVTKADIILTKNIELYCLITDADSKAPVEGVKITLINKANGSSETFHTSEDGDIMKQLNDVQLNSNLNYEVVLEKKGYMTKTVNYSKVVNKAGRYNLHEELDLSFKKLKVGDDIGKMLDIKPIYFDLGKSTIRPDAAAELDKIVKAMNENPLMEIELGSHTDSRGSDAYNLKLSSRRAKASAKYIQERIENPNRIKGKGYGETKLLNKCKNGVKCTEEEHQMNRRTEFKVVKM